MKKIAHRGLKENNLTENTIEAFDNAIKNAYDGFECDCRLTKDNKIVINHNAFKKGILIRNNTYSDLINNYNINLPLLKNVLQNYKCLKLVELKEIIDIDSIQKYIDENTFFISFNTSYIKKLKEKYPKYKFAALNILLNDIENYNLDGICILEFIMNKSIERYFTNKGIKIFIYGIGKKIQYKTENPNVYYIVDF